MDSTVSGQGPIMGSYEHGNVLLGSIKGVQYLDQIKDNQDSAPGVSYLVRVHIMLTFLLSVFYISHIYTRLQCYK
jgi:hypothetical protein